ncbi:glycoside hydrolase [Olivibacter sp. CPCC 100613]|uniref:glycosyl hydrolase family 95 catalytic domain-containing protein n=1 Tax=Olivibacter sp. CPCC 100613 TaxID=3079931 RepID=UPI002FFCCD57
MIKRIVTGCFWLALFLHTTLMQAQSPSKIANEPLIQMDYERLVTRADLYYTEPVKRSEEGQPIGNGRMGSLVWTTPSQVKLQINRVDIFGNNSSSNNFFERNTEYVGAAANVDLDFGEQVFTVPTYHQHLSCYKGISTVKGKGITAEVMALPEQDVIIMHVKDKRTTPNPIMTNLGMLRKPITERGNHRALSKLEKQDDYMVLTQAFREDDYYCASAVVIGLSDYAGPAERTNESTMRLSNAQDATEFTVFIASAATFDSTENVAATAVAKMKSARKQRYLKLLEAHQAWWENFWQKSFIHLSSADKEADYIEQNYTYYLYVMASSSRGRFPTKFNGMLWATGGDLRQWGNAFWGANQSCLYNALFPTNHMELMDPLFNLYFHNYFSLEKAAEQQWRSKGIYIPETMGFDGVPAIPDNIAKEMQSLYLMEEPWAQRSARFMAYAETKIPFLSRWNWKHTGEWVAGKWIYKERGDGPYGPVNHLFSRGAKIAYQFWQKYEYTRDENWLRERAYPMLKGIGEFYRNFPNVKKESDDRYHIRFINDNESIWGGHNTVEEIAAMKGIFPVLIKASEILNVDADMRPIWQAFLAHLSPLTTNFDYQEDPREKEIWVGSLPPTSTVRGNGKRLPDGNTMPVWFFDLCNPGAQGNYWEIANNTFDAYFKTEEKKSTYLHVLSKLPIAGAILGREDAIRYLLPNQLRRAPKQEVMRNRMDLSEGFYTTNIQRLGRGAEALHTALCFNGPTHPGGEPIIRVFHAWPKEWDATFKLLTRNNFLVSASMNKGFIRFVEIKAQDKQTCRIQNPWPGQAFVVYRNGIQEQVTRDDLLILDTEKGDRIVIMQHGFEPARIIIRN